MDTSWSAAVLVGGHAPRLDGRSKPLLEIEGRAGWDAVVPRTAERWHPRCAIYAARVAPARRARLDRGALRVTDALSNLSVRAVDDADVGAFDADGRLLLNVNTPDDLRRAVARGPHGH
jgi:molybdopterin-guanine dinucleotide biosynthesis protein A